MEIKEVKRFSLRVFNSVSRLLPQLSPDIRPLTREHFRAIIRQKSVHLFTAENAGKIVGMLTLVIYRIPAGTRFWIEDVVVDNSERGKGYGKELTQFALDFAEHSGAETIELTSRPSRVAANKLYQTMGFRIRETNVYRYTLK
ncbi:MAG TPA: GNAT family N-acetyltransferase [Bacteroidales bacterium]|mgnify:CR=1 FL=1|jgi:ribosomal protein S18 acetylase RimI-like enzyme|nr:GNAT family N-acetyltransferase [Bacteroidales bacterium]HNR40630.1 GNAT family N-acetyltransferase [Bacteroidales bacterium]HPM18090.1 GNAT family N-acetyltransferase [Bacteroidales bacterium]HQG77274.1 GNAT family N-acetyltransferase [Bacteroidales bacterium]